jgi:hypothetical protein
MWVLLLLSLLIVVLIGGDTKLLFDEFLASLGGARTPDEPIFCRVNLRGVCSPLFVVRDVVLKKYKENYFKHIPHVIRSARQIGLVLHPE